MGNGFSFFIYFFVVEDFVIFPIFLLRYSFLITVSTFVVKLTISRKIRFILPKIGETEEHNLPSVF